MPDQNNQTLLFENILSIFFNNIVCNTSSLINSSPLLKAITSMYMREPSEDVYSFTLDDKSVAEAISKLKNNLYSSASTQIKTLNTPITYLLDELVCNIQQHAHVDKGHIFLGYNQDLNSIDIVIADFGITIYGSYVAAQKHLDKLGDSDADALNLAQNGYSVKNLPDTENRGYGISSNMSMVVDGLSGEFAVLSGNAFLLHSKQSKKILSLPPEIDFKGTMVIVRIPDKISNNFDLYKYIG